MTKAGNNSRTVWGLVGVILLLSGALIGMVVNTAQGLGDVRCDVTANATNITHLQEQVRELKAMRGTVNRIAIRLGVDPQEESE